jgi:hypothetical protein
MRKRFRVFFHSLRPIINFRFRIFVISSNQTLYYMNKIGTDQSFKAAYGDSMSAIYYLIQNSTNTFDYAICKQVFLTISVVIYSRKDFFLLKALSDKIEDLKSAGLIDFWHKQDVAQIASFNRVDSGPKILTLSQFSGGFYFWISGCVISFVSFVCESISLSSYKCYH